MSTDNERLKKEAELKIEAAKKAAEEKKREAEYKLEQDRIAKEIRIKSVKLMVKIAIPCVVICIIALLISVFALIPMVKVNNAMSLMAAGKYTEAKSMLETVNGFGSEKKLAVINALVKLDSENTYNTNFDLEIKAILDAEEQINIKYYLNGKNGSEDYYTYKSSEKFIGLLVPTKEGYQFENWELMGCEYSKDEQLTLSLCAVWNDGYKISYNLDGGISNNCAEYHKDGDEVTLEKPVRDGYTFVGWTGTDLSERTMEVTIPSGSYGDREYTAHWEANEYTFMLDANGGKVETTTVTAKFDDEYRLPVPERDYYTFVGWYNGETEYQDGAWFIGDNVNLTAKWAPTSYAIFYELNGGVNDSYNKETYTIEDGKITFNNPTKLGYEFKGWYADSALKKKITSIPTGSHGDITLYAKWEIVEYTITYKLDGGKLSGKVVKKFTINDLPVTLPTATKSGMTFLNWGKDTWDGEIVGKITECGNITVVASYLDPDLKLTLSTDQTYYVVESYSGWATKLVIPAYYQGKVVKEIGKKAFYDYWGINVTLTEVKLPKTITYIGGSAFYNQNELEVINIPDGVRTIGDYTFYSCSELKSINIPDGVRTIGSNAFYWCVELESIILPDSTREIGWQAFWGCKKLTFYCRASAAPEGWDDEWNYDRPVVWGYAGD